MSLRDFLLTMLGGQRRAAPPMVESFQVGTPVAIESEVRDLNDAFRLLPSAFRGVSVIAGTASKLPINVYRRRKGTDEVVHDHPLSEMMHPDSGRLNPWTASLTGWTSIFSTQQLVGNGYLLKDRMVGGRPLELHILRPDYVEVIAGRDIPVAAYRYTVPGGKSITYQAEEVIPFPLYNPTHPFIGQSPLMPARTAMVLEMYMVALESAFFKNGATLGGVVSFEKGVTKDVIQALMQNFNEKHQGVKNAHRWRGISGAQSVTEMGLSNKDLQYAEGLKWTMQSVCTALGVPIMMLGVLDGATYANSAEQKAIFYENTIQPLTAYRDAQINVHLVPAFGKDLYVRTDYTNVDALLPAMSEVRQTADAAFRSNAITRDEYRQWLKTRRTPDLAALDAGEPVYYSDLTMDVYSGGAATGAANNEATNAGSAPRRAPSVDDTIREAVLAAEQRARVEFRETAKKKETKVGKRIDKARPKFEKSVAKFMKRQEVNLLDNAAQLSFNDLHKIDDLLRAIQKGTVEEFDKALTESVATFGPEAMRDIDVDLPFNAVSERVLKFTASAAAKKVQLIDNATGRAVRAEIQKALLEAQIAGDNVVDTAGRIMEKGIKAGMEIRRGRAVAIAQTETTGAYNFADREAWKQSGVVDKKQWVAHSDSVTRDTHAEVDGTEVSIDEPFVVGDSRLMYPGDPAGSAEEVIECRCFMLPVMSRAWRQRQVRVELESLTNPSPGAPMNGKGVH